MTAAPGCGRIISASHLPADDSTVFLHLMEAAIETTNQINEEHISVLERTGCRI